MSLYPLPPFFYFIVNDDSDAHPIRHYKSMSEPMFQLVLAFDITDMGIIMLKKCPHISYVAFENSSDHNEDTCCMTCSVCNAYIPIFWFDGPQRGRGKSLELIITRSDDQKLIE